MDLQLSGKTALVTGGSLGIGLATARRLAAEGVAVAIAARDRARTDAAAARLQEETGGRVVGFSADMGHEDQVRRMVGEVQHALGPITILVNNAATAAGRARPPALPDITRDKLLAEIDVKVLGYLFAAQEAAPSMIEAGWGRIINVAGLAARGTGSSIGSIRNVAVAALTKNLADELGPKGVNVTCVHPGMTRTRRIEDASSDEERDLLRRLEEGMMQRNTIRRIVDADDIAVIIAFLASPLSMAINGDAIVCGGGTPGVIYY